MTSDTLLLKRILRSLKNIEAATEAISICVKKRPE